MNTEHYSQTIARWYSNKATASRGRESKPTAVVQPIKRPRATNAEDLFAKSLQAELRVAVSSQMQQEGSTTVGENLNIYRDVKKNTFNNLSDVDKARWRVLAEEHNEKIMAPPSADYIFEYVLLSVVIFYLLISS